MPRGGAETAVYRRFEHPYVIPELIRDRGCDKQEEVQVVGHDAVLEDSQGAVEGREAACVALYDGA